MGNDHLELEAEVDAASNKAVVGYPHVSSTPANSRTKRPREGEDVVQSAEGRRSKEAKLTFSPRTNCKMPNTTEGPWLIRVFELHTKAA